MSFTEHAVHHEEEFMARTPAPEGAKKLYVSEKLVTKIDKLVTDIATLRKAIKKNTPGAEDELSVAENQLIKAITSNWEEIKLASGIKPIAPAKAEKVPQKPVKATKATKKEATPEVPAEKPVATRKPRAKKEATEKHDRLLNNPAEA